MREFGSGTPTGLESAVSPREFREALLKGGRYALVDGSQQ